MFLNSDRYELEAFRFRQLFGVEYVEQGCAMASRK
jgi:hypothetical protein